MIRIYAVNEPLEDEGVPIDDAPVAHVPPGPRRAPVPPPPPAPIFPMSEEQEMEVAPAGEPMPVGRKIEPLPEEKPQADPSEMFEEVIYKDEPPDVKEEQLSVREKIHRSLNFMLPLRILYTSLAGLTTERTVHPDYVYWAGTRRHILVAWDEMKNDWRAFVVDRIREAKLEGTTA